MRLRGNGGFFRLGGDGFRCGFRRGLEVCDLVLAGFCGGLGFVEEFVGHGGYWTIVS
ncbi:conserved hypothetical protein [Candidatus Sulfotelmatomonas gaucii]|uniref:Uncharacterized protein n=1 Tax=Candidatus Sulfuritelmatomonas gaucii TaxID=2043161 RepID=A0A2N9L3S2_9BACT|nr:conserved hypothetical protein [Candidatus Sulfotelmatomonas gaucii]